MKVKSTSKIKEVTSEDFYQIRPRELIVRSLQAQFHTKNYHFKLAELTTLRQLTFAGGDKKRYSRLARHGCH